MSRGGKRGVPHRKHLPSGTLVGASATVKLLWSRRDLEPEPEPVHLLAPLFDESTPAPPLTQDESGIVALAIELLAHERTDHAWMVIAILFDGDSQADIAFRYGVTRSRVGQVRDRFLRRLRHVADQRGLSLPRAEDYRYTAATPPRHCYDAWAEKREKMPLEIAAERHQAELERRAVEAQEAWERRVNAEQQALVAARELAQPWTKYPLGSTERARAIDEHIEAHRPLVFKPVRPTGSKAEQDSWRQAGCRMI